MCGVRPETKTFVTRSARQMHLLLRSLSTYSKRRSFYSKRWIPNSCSGKFVRLQIFFFVFSYFRDDIARVLIVTFSILIFSDYPQSVQKAISYTSVDFSNTKYCLRVGRFRGKLHDP